VYFPIQIAFLLSEPIADFSGGEFVLTQQTPRAQFKRMQINGVLNHSDVDDRVLRSLIRLGKVCFAGNRRLGIYGRIDCVSGKRMRQFVSQTF